MQASRPKIKTRTIGVPVSDELFKRIEAQVIRETSLRNKMVNRIEIITTAIENYLDYWETAEIKPDNHP